MDQLPQIAGFELKSKLGSGASGDVFLAIQLSLQREVALKLLSENLFDASVKRRFRREAQSMAALQHPSLVRILAYQGERPQYISMEYLKGGTLYERLHPKGIHPGVAMDPASVSALGKDLLSALVALDEAELVHRDIKPGNILFRDSGEAVLGDLGLVSPQHSDMTRLTQPGFMVGTMGYIAPEVLRGLEPTHQGDLFAVGVVLFEALSGQHPFGGQPALALEKQVVPDLTGPPYLVQLILDLIQIDPVQRVKSAKVALARLKAERVTRPTGVPVRRSRPVYAVVTAAGILIGGYLGLHLGQDAPVVRWSVTPRVFSVVVPESRRRLMLCVRDEKGTLVRADDGQRREGGQNFSIPGLSPGSRYKATVMRAEGSGTAAEFSFKTPAELRILGTSRAPEGEVTIVACEPGGTVSWEPGGAAVTVGPTPRAIPMPPGKRPTTLLYIEGKNRVPVSVDWPGRDERSPLELGLLVNNKYEEIKIESDGRVLPLLEWTRQHQVQGLALRPGARGEPQLDPKQFERLAAAGVNVVWLLFNPSAGPEVSTWIKKPRVLAPPGRPSIQFAFEDTWLAALLADSKWSGPEGTIALVDRWKEAIAKAHWPYQLRPCFPLIFAWKLMMARFQHRSFDVPELLEVAYAHDDLVRAEKDFRQLDDVWQGRPVRGSVRGVLYANRNFFGNAGMSIQDRLTPLRDFLAARGYLPQAMVYFDVALMFREGGSRLTPQALHMLNMAEVLRGQRNHGPVGERAPALPRLEQDKPRIADVLSFRFADARHATQVLITNAKPVHVRFFPAAPGMLWSNLGEPEGPPVRRPNYDASPMDLSVGPGPTLYEEFDPVRVTIKPNDVVSIAESRQ
jgi:hypothetical protein